MQPVLKDIREITDSKEMYEARPNPFLSFFIYVLLGGLICAMVWMYFGEIDIVSKGVGVVRPNENISYIRNKVQGEVTYTALEEGKRVKQGDVLFTVGHENLDIKRLQIEGMLLEYEEQLLECTKLKESIEKGKNLFSYETEKENYERYVKYEQDYQNLKNTSHIESTNESITVMQTDINKQIYESKVREYDEIYGQLLDYKLSIEQEENVFKDSQCAYALEFNTYFLQLQELSQQIEEKELDYQLKYKLFAEGLSAKKEVTDAKVALERAQNELVKLKTTTSKAIETKLKEIDLAKELAVQESEKLIIDEQLLHTNEAQRVLSLKKYKTDTLIALYNQIDEVELNYASKKKELESIDLAIAECTLVAPIEGVIHLSQSINEGDLLDLGIEVATIIPMDDSMYKVEIFMPNRDIAGIKVGDIIKYKFDALPYKEYGQLEGIIKNISTDAKISETQAVSGYMVEGSIVNRTVYSYKNQPAEIKVGMTCEAHVVTEQKKILYYLLEKINLMD